MVSMDSVRDFIFGNLHPAVDQRTVLFFIEGLTGKQVIHDACGRKFERVCQDTADPDTENGHAVLVTVFLCRAHIRKFEPVAGQFTQSPDVRGRDKRSLDNVEAEEVGNPFHITLVRLFAFDGFHILGVCETVCICGLRILKMGIQYLPVDSMQTSWQPCVRS